MKVCLLSNGHGLGQYNLANDISVSIDFFMMQHPQVRSVLIFIFRKYKILYHATEVAANFRSVVELDLAGLLSRRHKACVRLVKVCLFLVQIICLESVFFAWFHLSFPFVKLSGPAIPSCFSL